MSESPSPWVALLRGINVGRNRRLAMADLRRTMEAEGLSDVRTLLQSGNALFSSSGRSEEELVATLQTAIERDFGYDLTVVVRPGDEVEALAAGNPFVAAGHPVDALHVLFPASVPSKAARAALAAAGAAAEGGTGAGDDFALVGRDVCLLLPDGVTGARLTYEVLARHLGPGTVRNWKTTTRIVEDLTRRR